MVFTGCREILMRSRLQPERDLCCLPAPLAGHNFARMSQILPISTRLRNTAVTDQRICAPPFAFFCFHLFFGLTLSPNSFVVTMDNHRSHQPFTEDNLIKLKEQIPLFPRKRLNKAKHRVHRLIRWLENQFRNVGILFAVRAQINNDDYGCRDHHYRDLVYKGKGNPDLENPKFWEDQLRSFQKYKPVVRIKEAKGRVRDALTGITKLGGQSLQVLENEEIYFGEG